MKYCRRPGQSRHVALIVQHFLRTLIPIYARDVASGPVAQRDRWRCRTLVSLTQQWLTLLHYRVNVEGRDDGRGGEYQYRQELVNADRAWGDARALCCINAPGLPHSLTV